MLPAVTSRRPRFSRFLALRGAHSRALPFVPSFIRFLPTLDARLPLSPPQPRRSARPAITGVYITTDVYGERINHFVFSRSIRSTNLLAGVLHAFLYFCLSLLHRGAAFDIGPFPGTARAFSFTSLARRNPRFASRPLCLPLTILSRLSSPTPFCSFSPRRRSHCPPIVISIRCLRTNSMRKRFYTAPEVKGVGARVPESHLITHLSRCTYYEKAFVIFNVSDAFCASAAGGS